MFHVNGLVSREAASGNSMKTLAYGNVSTTKLLQAVVVPTRLAITLAKTSRLLTAEFK